MSEPQRALYRDPNLNVMFGITLLSMMGVSSVAPAFPLAARALEIPPERVGLLITVFTLPGIFLTPVLGVLADRYGRKAVLLPALLLFSLAGGACALARTFEALLWLRFAQGVGAASLTPLTATLIGDLFPGRERSTAMGYNASVLSMGTAVYPALGGALALLGWHVPFALPVLGLGIAAAALTRLETVEIRPSGHFRGYLRQALAGMGSLKTAGLFLASFLTFVVLYGAYTVFIPLLLEARFGATPLSIGLVFTVGSLSTALVAARLGPLGLRFPEERMVPAAFGLYALAFLVIPRLPGAAWVALPVALFGAAHGINYPVVTSMLAGLAPTEHRAIFLSVNGMILRAGQTLGPLAAALFFAWGGMAGVFYATAALCAGVCATLPFMLKAPPTSS